MSQPAHKRAQAAEPCKPNAKLSEDTAIEIFAVKVLQSSTPRQSKSRMSAAAVARRFCTTEKIVRDIWSGRTWRRETAVLLDPTEASKILSGLRPPGRPKKSQSGDEMDSSPPSPISSAECQPKLKWLKEKREVISSKEINCTLEFRDTPCAGTDAHQPSEKKVHVMDLKKSVDVSFVSSAHLGTWMLDPGFSLALPSFNLTTNCSEVDPFHEDWPYWR
mmetsp:Transcript_36213/g.95301  ORF Transcript_36213/g.95301 Transcript_36213/m.95301 type:complete len:219 (-) Transcript_36213:97-753(-)